MSILQVSCDLPDGVESVLYPDEEEEEETVIGEEEDIAMLTPEEEMLVEEEDQLEIDEGKFFC